MKGKIISAILIILMIGGIIMAHDKTYVVCENMCFEEGYTKKQIDEKYAVLTGTIVTNTEGKGNFAVDYPEGFNRDNSIVISAAAQYGLGGTWSYGNVANNRVTPGVDLISAYILVTVNVSSTFASSEIPYKVVLMKI